MAEYRVAIPETIRRKIAELGLSSATTKALYRDLFPYLRTMEPEYLGRRIASPVPCVVCGLEVSDPAAGTSREIVLWVDDARQPDTRIVIEVALLP